MTNAERQAKWRKDNPGRAAQTQRRYYYKNKARRASGLVSVPRVRNPNKYTAEHRRNRGYLLSMTKNRAKKRGIPFSLVRDDIQIPRVCPVLGIPLSINRSGRVGRSISDGTPSIDRINPELGYTRENVVVVSFRANRLKNDASVEELQLLALYYGRTR